MPQMVVARHKDPVDGEKFRQRFIAPDVLGNAMGNLQQGDRRRFRAPEPAVQSGFSIL